MSISSRTPCSPLLYNYLPLSKIVELCPKLTRPSVFGPSEDERLGTRWCTERACQSSMQSHDSHTFTVSEGGRQIGN
jgi:hypothetical protein